MKTLQVFYHDIITYCLCLLILSVARPVGAVNTVGLNVGVIASKGWTLEGVSLTLVNLNQNKPHFKLSAEKLKLPKPFNDLTLADIRCTDFIWQHDEIHCSQGRASVQSTYWQSPSTKFALHLSTSRSSLKLDDTRLGRARFSLGATAKNNAWQCQLNGKNITNDLIDKLFQVKPTKSKPAQSKQGQLMFTSEFSGDHKSLQQASVRSSVTGLTDQTIDDKIASDNLTLTTQFKGKKSGADWHWQSESKLLSGALYVDPVYLESNKQPITLNIQGYWRTKKKQADVRSFAYYDPKAGRLMGSGKAFYKDKLTIDAADITLQSDNIQELLTTYANPFFVEPPFTNVKATGEIKANISFVQQTLQDVSIQFNKLNADDEARHIAINDGSGWLNWSDNPTEIKRSELTWQQLSIKGLPIESAKLRFVSEGNQVRLVEKINLPFLEGTLAVDKFSWQGKKHDEPDVSFAGRLDDVSLEKLSEALGWIPLSGKISGQIPGVSYHDKTLSLEGGIQVQAFDGTLKINHLSSKGLLGAFPRVFGEIEVDRLDLDQLTQKFEFGNITGRLSGYIKKVTLENWHPVTFYAWLGTPDNDDSRHRISQKAVNNIASIGGGGATNLLSRSFLGFFETFGYDKIGMGCYLHEGVCQVMGLEAAGQGYYLIKGGGLPRIDVLGYNPRVNWDVLVERLGRVAAPDKIIVQ